MEERKRILNEYMESSRVPSIYDIIDDYLKQNIVNDYMFKGHIIETVLPDYGRIKFAIMHTPGSYSRAWRKIREHNLLPHYIIEEETGLSKEKVYRVKWRTEQFREVSVNQ